jgi:hypothetical protein
MLMPAATLPNNAFPLLCRTTLEHIHAVLAPKGIRPVVLKGPHLAHTVYPRSDDRTWTDLDLLVAPAEFPAALEALVASGYGLAEPMPGRTATDLEGYHRELRSPIGVQVELHRDVAPHACWPVDIAAWMERAEPFRMDGVEALGLCPEDLLLHLCLHIVKSHFDVEEKHFRDIERLLQARPIDWDSFLVQAGAARCRTGCYYVLLAARCLHEALVPSASLRRLRPGVLRRAWMDRQLVPGRFPVLRSPYPSRLRTALALHFPLLDRVRDWPAFAFRYLRLRGMDAAGRRPLP